MLLLLYRSDETAQEQRILPVTIDLIRSAPIHSLDRRFELNRSRRYHEPQANVVLDFRLLMKFPMDEVDLDRIIVGSSLMGVPTLLGLLS